MVLRGSGCSRKCSPGPDWVRRHRVSSLIGLCGSRAVPEQFAARADRHLGELFRALGSHDLRTASALAARIADDEERLGHRSAAALLRGALNSRGTAIHLPAPQFDITAALIAENPGPPLDTVVLTETARRELLNICAEWKHRHELERQSLSRRTKLVFSGPPGCGKTLTARSLGTRFEPSSPYHAFQHACRSIPGPNRSEPPCRLLIR